MRQRDRLFDIGAGHDPGARAEQLEHEHRGHDLSAWRGVLSLGILRQAWPRLWTPPLTTPAITVPRPSGGNLALSFVGHGTAMLTSANTRLLVDPLFENWLGWLHRARAACIHSADLAEVGIVLVSSAHADRLSPRSLARIPRTATVVVPGGCGAQLAGLEFARVVELSVGNSLVLDGIEVSAVPAHPWKRHPSSCGYVVRCQDHVIYFAGETGYFPGFSTIGARHAPQTAVLPIAGYQPASFRRRRLSPLGAIYAFEDLRARQLIPVAHGSFALGYEPLDEPERWLRELVRQRRLESAVTFLAHGQTTLLRR